MNGPPKTKAPNARSVPNGKYNVNVPSPKALVGATNTGFFKAAMGKGGTVPGRGAVFERFSGKQSGNPTGAQPGKLQPSSNVAPHKKSNNGKGKINTGATSSVGELRNLLSSGNKKNGNSGNKNKQPEPPESPKHNSPQQKAVENISAALAAALSRNLNIVSKQPPPAPPIPDNLLAKAKHPPILQPNKNITNAIANNAKKFSGNKLANELQANAKARVRGANNNSNSGTSLIPVPPKSPNALPTPPVPAMPVIPIPPKNTTRITADALLNAPVKKQPNETSPQSLVAGLNLAGTAPSKSKPLAFARTTTTTTPGTATITPGQVGQSIQVIQQGQKGQTVLIPEPAPAAVVATPSTAKAINSGYMTLAEVSGAHPANEQPPSPPLPPPRASTQRTLTLEKSGESTTNTPKRGLPPGAITNPKEIQKAVMADFSPPITIRKPTNILNCINTTFTQIKMKSE